MEKNLKSVSLNVEAIEKIIKSQNMEVQREQKAMQDEVNRQFKNIE